MKTFQAEQEQAALIVPVRKKSAKVKVKPEIAGDTLSKDEPASADSSAVSFQPINTEDVSERKLGKKRARSVEPDDFKDEDDSDIEVQEKPKKKKRAKKSATATGQLYGAPPKGTIIP